jgi:hypothetical protein
MFQCTFCGKEWEIKKSHTQHQNRCKLNPNSIASNQFSKAKQLNIRLTLDTSDEAKLKRTKRAEAANSARWAKPDAKEKASASMKKAVENNPESYTSSNRGRVKQIEYHGLKFHGNWEFEFYKFCERNEIACERVTKFFPYVWNGSSHNYFPDFYLPSLNAWVEIKGYKTERDDAKWEQFPFTLVKIMKEEIKSIKRNDFDIRKVVLGS